MKFLCFLCVVVAFPAVGANLVGESNYRTLVREGKNLRGTQSFNVQLAPRIYQVKLQKQLVEEMDFGECETKEVKAPTGNWNEVFTAPFGERPARLAASVKGLSLSAAKRLIYGGHFASQPKSWFELAFLLEQADETFQTGFPFDVLVTYKKENMESLGYMTEGECDFEIHEVHRRVPVKQLARQEKLEFGIQMKNAPLLAGEKETIRLLTDGFTHNLFVSSHFNSYKVEKVDASGVIQFVVTGTRKLVRPSNELQVEALNSNGKLQLSVVDESFDPESNQDVHRYLVGKVYDDRSGWRRAQEVGEVRALLSDTSKESLLEDLGIELDAKRSYRIQYSVQHYNSRYLSPVPSIRRTTRLRGE